MHAVANYVYSYVCGWLLYTTTVCAVQKLVRSYVNVTVCDAIITVQQLQLVQLASQLLYGFVKQQINCVSETAISD